MPKGDTHKKKHNKTTFVKHDLVLANKDEGEFYARVQGKLNGDRISIKDIQDNLYQAKIPGSFFGGSKKENVNFVDSDKHEYWVLIEKGISKNQYSLKHIYNENDRVKLLERGELSNNITQHNVIDNIIENIENIEDDNSDWLDNI